jgi:hypothetical protein
MLVGSMPTINDIVPYAELRLHAAEPQSLGVTPFVLRRVRGPSGPPQVAKIYQDLKMMREAMHRENRALSRLQHVNIVRAFGKIVNVAEDHCGLLLEDVDQPLLSAPRAFHHSLRHMIDVAAALAHAHDHNVVYNALDETTVRVVGATAEQCGVAKLVDFTRSIVLVGWQHSHDTDKHSLQSLYAAPERIPSFKADVFAFGILGRKLFCPGDRIFESPPLPAETSLPESDAEGPCSQTSRALSGLIDWCTEEQPCNRPTMAEIHTILGTITEVTAQSVQERRESQAAANRHATRLPYQRDGYRHSDWLYDGPLFNACSDLVSQRTSGALLQVLGVTLVKMTDPVTTTAIVGDSEDDASTQLPPQLASFIAPGLTADDQDHRRGRRLYTFYGKPCEILDHDTNPTAHQCAFHAAPKSHQPTVQDGVDAHFIPVRHVEGAWQAATGNLTTPTAHQVVVKSGTLLSPVAVVKIRIRQIAIPPPPPGTQSGRCVSPLTGAAMVPEVVPDPAAAATLAELLSNPAYTSLQGTGLVVVHSALFDDLDKIEQDLVTDLGLRPPSIVCLGNESSGKSTLLERLIGFPVLPRDKDLCTRMIIRLLLRRGPYTPTVDILSEILPLLTGKPNERCNQGPLAIGEAADYVAIINAIAAVQEQFPDVVAVHADLWERLERAVASCRYTLLPSAFGDAAALIVSLIHLGLNEQERDAIILGWFAKITAMIRFALTSLTHIPRAIECFVALKASALWCSQLTCLCSYAPECREFDDLFAELTAVCAALHFDIECPEQFLSILKVIEAWRASGLAGSSPESTVLFACRNSFAGIMRQLGDSESDLTLLQWADAVFKYRLRLEDQFGHIPMDAIERHCKNARELGAQRDLRPRFGGRLMNIMMLCVHCGRAAVQAVLSMALITPRAAISITSNVRRVKASASASSCNI